MRSHRVAVARRIAAGLGIAALGAGLAVPAAAVTPVEPRVIEFEPLGIVVESLPHNAFALPLRIDGPDDRWDLWRRVGGTDDPVAAQLVAIVDGRYPGAIPDDVVLLIGAVHTGCFPAAGVGVVAHADGTVGLAGTADPQEGSVACFRSLTTVAVVAIDADDAPAGSADGATLVAFTRVPEALRPAFAGAEVDTGLDTGTVGDPLIDEALAAVTLPPRSEGDRRFAFVRPGCRHTTAELVVTRTAVDATLERARGDAEWDCAVAEYFLAVFDVPADRLPSTAEVAGA